MAYSLEMMTIANDINRLIATKAYYLLLNTNLDISEKYRQAVFNTSVYILNQTSSSSLKFDTFLHI